MSRTFILCVAAVAISSVSCGSASAEVIADSIGEFSNVQGQDNWYYGYYDGDSSLPFSTEDFEQMDNFGVIPGDIVTWHVDYYTSPGGFWTTVDAVACHPNGEITSGDRQPAEHWAVRRWVSEWSGTIQISGNIGDVQPQSGDGIVGRIIVDDVAVWSQVVENGNTVGIDYEISVDVTAGSLVDFAVAPRLTDWYDGTRFTALIARALCVTASRDNRCVNGNTRSGNAAAATSPTETSLIAHWAFDVDGSDAIGTHDGILGGDALISNGGSGVAGECLVLDGDGDYWILNDATADFNLSSFSVSLWYRGSTNQRSLYALIDLHHGGSHGPYPHGWVSQARLSGGIGFVGYGSAGLFGAGYPDGDSLLDDRWHHLVASYAEYNELRVYIDGESVDVQSLEGIPPPTYDGLTRLTIARLGAAADEGLPPNARDFFGRIDDVQIYDEPLDASAVVYLYDNPGAVWPPAVCRSSLPDDRCVNAGALGDGGTPAPGRSRGVTNLLTNGDFETGDLTGWTGSGIDEGYAYVVEEGTCFSYNDTTGIELNGAFAVNVRSTHTPSSIGILTSDLFVLGGTIAFRALSENDDQIPHTNPVTFEVRLLDQSDAVLLSQVIVTNIITLSSGCPTDPRNAEFSSHVIDTSPFAGNLVRLQFRQHTNVGGKGFFTLIDDVQNLAICPSAMPDAGCVNGSLARSGAFPSAGLDDFATTAAFKVQMLDGTEYEITGLTDDHTIIGRSGPFLDGDPEDDAATIFGGGEGPYPCTAAIAGDPCVMPGGFPESSYWGQEIHTEILSLNLTNGIDSVKAGQPFCDSVAGTPQDEFYQNSFGEVQGLDHDFPGDSIFNIFVEVTVGSLKFYNKTPMLVRAEIDQFPPDLSLPRSVYLHNPSFGAVPLFDEDGLHVAYLLSAGHGSVEAQPPACQVETLLSSPVSFTVDALGTGPFPTELPNHVKDDDGQDVQQVTTYVSSGGTPGASPDITNARIGGLTGNIGGATPPDFAAGDAINSLSYGRDGSRNAVEDEVLGTLLFSVDRDSIGETCTGVRLGAESTNADQAADVYIGSTISFGAYAGSYLPRLDVNMNNLLADQTVLGLRPLLGQTGQDNLTGLEVSAFGVNDRFYGTFLGDSFDCGDDDCNDNGTADGCEPDCQPNGVADGCDIDPTDPDGNGSVSDDLNTNGFPDECEPCGPECTTPPRSLQGATIFVYDDQGDPIANPFQLVNLLEFAQAADLGLLDGDVIDALVLSDLTPGGGDPQPNGVMDSGLDEVLFSLSRSSPSLFGADGAPGQAGVDDDSQNGIDDPGETGLGDDRSPADIFRSGFDGSFTTFASSTRLGLLATDNVDALDIGPTLEIDDCNCNDVDDECDIARGFSTDCNTNGIPDECERAGNDCNCNDIPDECDIDPEDPDGNGQVSDDCQPDGVPDECEPDCDLDGIPDECELANCPPEDLSCRDCNGNQIPDGCDITDGTSEDCRPNSIPDECEADCDDDGVPDDCELADCPPDDPSCQDCNANGLPDVCDISDLTSDDCNGNGIPDECEIDENSTAPGGPFFCDLAAPPVGLMECSPDCNENGIPDDCETDCQPNDVPDDCDIDGGGSSDCQPNGTPDECEPDCDDDGLPDECETDCQPNGVPDDCDIDPSDPDGNGEVSLDVNDNQVPDECELVDPPLPLDLQVRKNRYISFDPNNADNRVAMQVNLTSMRRCSGDLRRACIEDADCPGVCNLNHDLQCEDDVICSAAGPCVPTLPCIEHPDVATGLIWWVDQPFESVCFPFDDCVGEMFAHLRADPLYREWPESVLHVTDCEIVPVVTYEVRARLGEAVSDPLELGTIEKPHVHYADCVGPVEGDPPAFTPPDGFVNVTDVQAYLIAYQGGATAPATIWVDLHGVEQGSACIGSDCIVPQQILNVGDLQTIKFGFQGKTYVETPGQENPGDCP